jgi:hypothetical protein
MQRSIMLFGAIALGCFAIGAQAAPVTLTCTAETGNQSLQLIFDEEAKTATAGDDPVSDATFTDTTITWGELDLQSGMWAFHKNYSLNRDTGVLRLYGAQKADNQEQWANLNQVFHCAVSKKLF